LKKDFRVRDDDDDDDDDDVGAIPKNVTNWVTRNFKTDEGE
jgi:hypothetical protein